jgi:hypothetical protein
LGVRAAGLCQPTLFQPTSAFHERIESAPARPRDFCSVSRRLSRRKAGSHGRAGAVRAGLGDGGMVSAGWSSPSPSMKIKCGLSAGAAGAPRATAASAESRAIIVHRTRRQEQAQTTRFGGRQSSTVLDTSRYLYYLEYKIRLYYCNTLSG